MSTQVSTFLILFLKTRFVKLFPCKSNTFKLLLVLNVAAKGSIHFSVNLLCDTIKLYNEWHSVTPRAKCYNPSSVILLWLKSKPLKPPNYFKFLTISFIKPSLILFDESTASYWSMSIALNAWVTTLSLLTTRFNPEGVPWFYYRACCKTVDDIWTLGLGIPIIFEVYGVFGRFYFSW